MDGCDNAVGAPVSWGLGVENAEEVLWCIQAYSDPPFGFGSPTRVWCRIIITHPSQLKPLRNFSPWHWLDPVHPIFLLHFALLDHIFSIRAVISVLLLYDHLAPFLSTSFFSTFLHSVLLQSNLIIPLCSDRSNPIWSSPSALYYQLWLLHSFCSILAPVFTTLLDWIGLGSIGLYWIGLGWIGSDCISSALPDLICLLFLWTF